MAQTKTHWKKAFNPAYLGSYAFQPGEEKVGTIASIEEEEVTGMSGKKEECLVAHFQEPDMKPLIMNKTNCKAAAKLFGTDYIEDWIGRSFVMGVRSVSAYGDTVDAVRVLPKRPPRKAPQICTDCGQEIIGTAKGTAEQVAQASAARFGRKLCAECAAKELKKEKEGTENVGA